MPVRILNTVLVKVILSNVKPILCSECIAENN
ncbi:Uncharacterised protein [Vibrio cholerae]|nr:Uncharacterised protein [Vibrio cholerae]